MAIRKQQEDEHKSVWRKLLQMEQLADQITARLLRIEREKGIFLPPPEGKP